jgi:hypothetical protein
VSAGLPLAGCGGGEKDKGVRSKTVIDHFENQTGERLIRRTVKKTLPYEPLSFPSLDGDYSKLSDEELRRAERYGEFTIWVVKADEDADKAIKKLLKADDTEDEVLKADETVAPGPDSEGIVWTRTCYTFKDSSELGTRCSYSASKRFAENVLLRWQGRERKETNATWDRLNTILSNLPQ